MYKSAAVLGLVAIAAAQAPGSYGDSSSAAAPAYSSSSAAPAYSSSSDPVPSSSSSWGAPSYPSASGSYSSAPVSSSGIPSYPASSYPSSSYVSATPSSSYPAPSSSAVIPSSSPYPACWSACFEEAGITSESALCGNVEVDQCITESCCVEESWAYWQWYDSFCPAPSSSSSYAVPSSSTPVSSSPASATPTDNCWTDCFAENDITSEDQLCGNTAVDACIHDTCSAALDKAYWDWYTGFCVAASSSVVTVTTVYTPTVTPYGAVSTTYEYTSEIGYTPVSSATGLPAPPASPVAPYGGYTTAAWGTSAAPTGTAYSSPSASAWAPVPATGAGSIAKPGFFLGAAMALAALF